MQWICMPKLNLLQNHSRMCGFLVKFLDFDGENLPNINCHCTLNETRESESAVWEWETDIENEIYSVAMDDSKFCFNFKILHSLPFICLTDGNMININMINSVNERKSLWLKRMNISKYWPVGVFKRLAASFIFWRKLQFYVVSSQFSVHATKKKTSHLLTNFVHFNRINHIIEVFFLK